MSGELVEWNPDRLSGTLHGLAIEEQTQAIFGRFGTVTGVLLTAEGIAVQYEGGLDVLFAPVASGART